MRLQGNCSKGIHRMSCSASFCKSLCLHMPPRLWPSEPRMITCLPLSHSGLHARAGGAPPEVWHRHAYGHCAVARHSGAVSTVRSREKHESNESRACDIERALLYAELTRKLPGRCFPDPSHAMHAGTSSWSAPAGRAPSCRRPRRSRCI